MRFRAVAVVILVSFVTGGISSPDGQGVGRDNYVALGNPGDEEFHNPRGWGGVNPGLLPDSVDVHRSSRYQLLRASNSVDLFVNLTGIPYTLTFRTENGICDDSFDIYVNGQGPLYQYRQRPLTYRFPLHTVQLDRSVVTSTTATVTFRNMARDSCGHAAVYFVKLEPDSSVQLPISRHALFQPMSAGEYRLGQGWLGESFPGLFHLGQDYCVSARADVNSSLRGTTFFPIAPGQLVQIRYNEPAQRGDGVGNFAIVDHFDGIVAVYMHLARIYVRPGQMLDVQDALGEAGDPILHPRPNCPHLHLEIRTKSESGLNVSPNLRYAYVSRDGRTRLMPPLVPPGTPSQESEGAVRLWASDNFLNPSLLRTRSLLPPGRDGPIGGVVPPGFLKTSPVNGAPQQRSNITLSWQANAAAQRYEYCYDTTNNNSCDGNWISNWWICAEGTVPCNRVPISGLRSGTTYYWQVRARNAAGTTEANGGVWWSFRMQ